MPGLAGLPRAAGSMTSSTGDLARLLSALLDGGIIRNSARAAIRKPQIRIKALHESPTHPDKVEGREAVEVGLAYELGRGLLTHTRFGPAFFKEGHGDGAQKYIDSFEKQKFCMNFLTNSDNGEAAFRPLLGYILGDTVTAWEWEGYTQSWIDKSRKTPKSSSALEDLGVSPTLGFSRAVIFLGILFWPVLTVQL